MTMMTEGDRVNWGNRGCRGDLDNPYDTPRLNWGRIHPQPSK